jgi:hypothetical protein
MREKPSGHTRNERWIRRVQRDPVLDEAAWPGVAQCGIWPCPNMANWAAYYAWGGMRPHAILCDDHAIRWAHVQDILPPPVAPVTTVVGPPQRRTR